jgi:cell division protein FtsQ
MAAVSRSGRARAAVLPSPPFGRGRAFALAKPLPSGRALVLGFALLAGGALAYVGARETSLFALNTIRITGAPPRVAAHVRAALAPLEGRSLVGLDQGAIERRLAGLPDVAAASFDRDFPHTLRVYVTPAHSIAVLRRGPSAWIVSSDGRVIRSAGRFGAPKLPRIWVSRATAVDAGAQVGDSETLRALAALAAARRAGFATRIALVRATGHELTFVLPGRFELRLGDASALALKLAVAARLLPIARTTSTYIDLGVPERPVAGGNPQVSTSG